MTSPVGDSTKFMRAAEGGSSAERIKAFYETDTAVRAYPRWTYIDRAEQLFLASLNARVLAPSILDVGVGCGRTTSFLLKLSRRYTGLDYSFTMIRNSKSAFPGVTYLVADARTLPFVDNYFDLVFFSFNGLDNVNHDERLGILTEIHRVLKPGGLFIFSSHNNAAKPTTAFSLRNLSFTWNPASMVVRFIRYVSGITNYLRNRRLQILGEDYSLILDIAYNYRLPHYYVTVRSQIQQLQLTEFSVIGLVDADGRVLDVETAEPKSPWVYYLAQRPGASTGPSFSFRLLDSSSPADPSPGDGSC